MALQKISRSLLNTGVADSSNATAITIDSSENVTFAGSIKITTNGKLLEIADAPIQWYSAQTSDYKIALMRAASYNLKGAGNSSILLVNNNGISVTGTITGDGYRTPTDNTNYNLLTRNSSNTAVYIQQAGSGNILDVQSGSASAGQGTTRLLVKSNGNVGIGTTTPDNFFHIHKAASGSGAKNNSITPLVIENSTHAMIQFDTPNNAQSGFYFGDPQSAVVGELAYEHAVNGFHFYTAGASKVKFNTTGQILANSLGVTTPTFAFINDTNTGMTRPTGDTLQFVTGGSARWRINSSGHFTPENQHAFDIGGTNAEVRNIYAQGISFASHSNYSGMSSELLDDYEEGNHTATITCASGTITLYSTYNNLCYTKIGRLVHIQGKLAIQAVSSPSGATTISLPFAIANLADQAGACTHLSTGYFNGGSINTGFHTVFMEMAEGQSYVRPYVLKPSSTAGNAPGTHNIGDGYTATGSDIYVNFSYIAA